MYAFDKEEFQRTKANVAKLELQKGKLQETLQDMAVKSEVKTIW